MAGPSATRHGGSRGVAAESFALTRSDARLPRLLFQSTFGPPPPDVVDLLTDASSTGVIARPETDSGGGRLMASGGGLQLLLNLSEIE